MNDIAKIDKNFEVKEDLNDNDNLDLYAIPNDKTALYGIFYEEERFVRLPKEVAYQNSRALIGLYKKTAGGRLRFSTNSKSATKCEIVVGGRRPYAGQNARACRTVRADKPRLLFKLSQRYSRFVGD